MDNERKYKEALERAKNIYGASESKDILSTLTTIFPELKEESEDEWIRKTLIEYFKVYPKDYYCELKTSSIIDWLEKQGEQKPLVIDEGKAEMDYCFTKMMNGEKVSSYWSEDDEKMVKDIIAAIDTLYYHGMVNWLKSLKYRVQPKQEWSEDDKGNMLEVKCIIDKAWHNQDFREDTGYSSEELESLWNWFDNIWQRVKYPQNTWKPSEEQMQALAEALSLAKNCGEENAFDLRTLHEQLKKLKGE